MSSSLFFLQAERNKDNSEFIKSLEQYSIDHNIQVFVINKPLGDNKYTYNYTDGLVVLIPKHKIMIMDFGSDKSLFEDYAEDFIEDLGSISDKYQYRQVIGRPRNWRREVVSIYEESSCSGNVNVNKLVADNVLKEPSSQRNCELMISLLTGSINDIQRVKEGIPDNILDKIKQKILLFDGEQTRFIYQEGISAKVTIQGLSGTGKTELLLHKLKDIYLNQSNSRILFTCHNRILASNLRKRIPEFFNFMKVEEQIKWNERLWCIHAWGSQGDPDSGAYRYICHKYNADFHRFSYSMPFEKACQIAINNIKLLDLEKIGYAFDYVLLDESQDFPKEFVELCMLVTKNTVYVAGDIFQSIFDENIVSEIKPDYLLSKCYRTDPRTLMFAHGLGMGLFESKKLRWLEDNEWEACGYDIEKNADETMYTLKREPLRRFEDLNSYDITSMEIIKTSSSVKELTSENTVITVMKKIIKENPTVSANDIGIIFIGSQKRGYELADVLEYLIPQNFGWELNKAYETKIKINDMVFISNKNNVKGLEFPFVICVSDFISNAPNERNALYMMLTRSFIQTYLLVSDNSDIEKMACIEEGLEFINHNGYMSVTAPTAEERDKIKTKIDFDHNTMPIYDLVMSIFDELDVPPLWREPIFGIVKALNSEKVTYELVKAIVKANVEKMDLG